MSIMGPWFGHFKLVYNVYFCCVHAVSRWHALYIFPMYFVLFMMHMGCNLPIYLCFSLVMHGPLFYCATCWWSSWFILLAIAIQDACSRSPDDPEAQRAIDLLYDTALISSGFTVSIQSSRSLFHCSTCLINTTGFCLGTLDMHNTIDDSYN